jgi:hypothetical protein
MESELELEIVRNFSELERQEALESPRCRAPAKK